MAGPLSEVQLASLPQRFRILVVCGPTGSGKTRIIHQLRHHYGLEGNQGDIVFEDDEAVCGHADLGDDFLEKLQAVGFWAEKKCALLDVYFFFCWACSFLLKFFEIHLMWQFQVYQVHNLVLSYKMGPY